MSRPLGPGQRDLAGLTFSSPPMWKHLSVGAVYLAWNLCARGLFWALVIWHELAFIPYLAQPA